MVRFRFNLFKEIVQNDKKEVIRGNHFITLS